MAFWLVKSESSVYSIDDLCRDGATHWHGVRNYQARNYLKQMKAGDFVLFYHSVDEPIGVAGLCKVQKVAYPDPSQFDKKSDYYDQSASKDNPRWYCPDLKFVKKFDRIVSLKELKAEKTLKGMVLLQKGSRLSVQPVTEAQFNKVLGLSNNQDKTKGRND